MEFDPDSTEYKRVYELLLEWINEKRTKSVGDYNPNGSTEGDIMAIEFENYVKDNHPIVYNMVVEDGLVYTAALMDWNMRE